MEFAGRMELRHPPLSNMRYSAKLYNVEGIDHNVFEPVPLLGMATCKVKKIEEWPTQASTSFEQENIGEWGLKVGSMDSI